MELRIKNNKLFILLIIISTTLVYLNILDNEFVWDDNAFILGWKEIRSLSNIPSLIAGNVPHGHEGVYRPVRGVFYALSYNFFGLNPLGYHIQAIIIHLISTILIYLITIHISKKKIIALITSLIFGIHPIHTNAIAFITSSFDQIGVIFFLLSFYFYIKATENEKFNRKKYYSSIFFAFLAFFSYELTLTLPLVLILFDYFFNQLKNSNKIWKIYLPYFILIVIYLSIRFFIVNTTSRGGYLEGSFYLTMLAMSKVIVKEIILLLFPVGLSVLHTIPRGILTSGNTAVNKQAILSQSIFDFDILISIAIIICLLFIAFYYRKKSPMLSFSIAFFFVTLLPVMNIIPLQTLLDEDFLYLPSFSYSLIFSYAFFNLHSFLSRNYFKIKNIAVILFIIILLSYSFLTISRNEDWKDEISLWLATVEKAPTSDLVHNDLGIAYDDLGKKDLAIHEYKKAIEINPNHAKAHYNLGMAYRDIGELDLAVNEFQEALKINPTLAPAYNDLGLTYKNQGKIDLAIVQYKGALKYDSKSADIYNNLGNAYKMQGNLSLAIDAFNQAIQLEPNNAIFHNNLATAYHEQGKIELAIQKYNDALKFAPNNAAIHFNLGIAFQQEGKFEMAVKEFQTALNLEPKLIEAKKRIDELTNTYKK